MMHPRWLALPLAVITASATVTGCASGPTPRLLSTDLHVGALDDRTSFELDDRGSPEAGASDNEVTDEDVSADTPKQQRRRKLLYWTGIGAIGFGIVGTVGFGVGGRIVQGQMKTGYEEDTLTRDRYDQLSTTGKVMNGLAIGSAVVGLLGVIAAATAYGIDHARCGDLKPRRKQCAGQGGSGTVTTEDATGTAGAQDGATGEAGAPGAGGAGGAAGTGGPANGPATAPGSAAAAPEPAARSPEAGPAPTSPTGPAGGKPVPGSKPASSPSPAAPGSNAPGSSAPGTASPGTAAPGTAAPG